MIKKLFSTVKPRQFGLSRVWSGSSGQNAAKYTEDHLKSLLEAKFPDANSIQVADVSGGCGAMYEIFVESLAFKGMTTIKQHRLITETLKAEIKDMHGVRIFTSIPKADKK